MPVFKKLKNGRSKDKENKSGKSLVSFILSIVAAYFIAAFAILIFQRAYIYYPTENQVSDPAQYGADYISYVTSDGLEITSWYCAAKENRPVIMMFHGNGGNISHRSNKQAFFCSRGYGFLLAEYRGYGGNEGAPSESGLYKDARAALGWLKEQQVNMKDVVIYGESIGTGVAMQMALEYPATKAVVLEAPFTGLRNVAKDVMPWFSPFSYFIRDTYDNLSKVEALNMPLLILHGDKDNIIPARHSEILYSRAKSENSHLTMLKGGNHNDLTDFGLLENIQDFLERLSEG